MLTVITGSMFAEKSTELQRRGRRLERAGKTVAYFKPNFDTRYSENEIVTHNGEKVHAFNIEVSMPDELLDFMNHDVYLIDEIQFFNHRVVEVIKFLLKKGKTVIVAGLDIDFQANPFIVTASLMAIAEDVVKLKAVCNHCGQDAWVSDRKTSEKERNVLGSSDTYQPLCRKCYDNKNPMEEF
ncbi:thymidine kinase [Neobacillus niacini]|uniref:thymidine kinase n=1 Tax=Neobacillus driksii TaxID=3035913 RepID=UPI002786F80C|nr:thymidine kinase [Neobacillus niacini]MDQ0976675.1 thymidine kinase [Neobacillus niacini]